MTASVGIPNTLLLLGLLAAVVVLAYFVVRGLQQDHATGDYHFTWGVGIVALFLLGFAPGLVGVGLYLTVERRYPTYWLVLSLVLTFVVLGIVGSALHTDVSSGVTGSIVAG